MERITLPAYAKLNLTLDILARRSDGYHELQMVMQSISLHDDVTAALTDGTEIVCRCGALAGDDSNLAVKAAKVFFARCGIAPRGLAIDIEKRIPMQAGMAGGSADAAAVLRVLRTLLAPTLADDALEEIGAAVGSDVPYCVRGGTVLAEGRGEKLTTLRAAPRFSVVVCKPDFPISTPELFRRSDSAEILTHPDTAGMLRAIECGNAEALAQKVCNAFEQVLSPEQSEVFRIKDALCALGASAAAMTGSGSSVFGLFPSKEAAAAAFRTLALQYREIYLAEFV